ncbi:MAG: DUF3168 domain-containing protein [Sphaerotilus natans subsp. sulfidivorans]|uniref:tail completion protein gp17 n=1 Tax=Sphaerotilus sulfidivorans TaxID=639200 RepID=UPI0023540E52|nr:DUF3168 domain-containing protein [Sphaerotilus sulfidivorans]MCK6401257.1 DUF3168 domain-containing protein [Sphaerotilus sulfidivorans]
MSESLHARIRTALLAHPPLVVLIGTRAAAHAAGEGWPMPYVIWSLTEQPDLGMSGQRLGATVTVQVECWATSALTASAIADAAVQALADLPAVVTSRTTGTDDDAAYDHDTVTAVFFTD